MAKASRKALYVQGFSEYFRTLVQTAGGTSNVAEVLNVPKERVAAWQKGASIPALPTLVRIATCLGTELAPLLEAAGKPPIDQLRHHTAEFAHDSLPLYLNEWRNAEHGGDTARAANAVGVSRWAFGRYCTGAKIPTTIRSVYEIARALRLQPHEILLMTGAAESTVTWKSVTGVAKMIRDGLESIGVDHLDPDAVKRIAPQLGVQPTGLTAWIHGAKVPGMRDCLRLSEFTKQNVRTLLKEAGVKPGDALLIAKALRVKQTRKHHHLDPTLADFLRSYRITSGMPQYQVAKAMNIERTTYLRYESGENQIGLEHVVVFSKVTNAPLERLLHAALIA